VVVGGRGEAVAVVRALLAGKGPQAMQDMAVLNLGVALHLLEEDLSLQQALDKARTAMAEGAAAKAFPDSGHA
jgi:anthranilate phosphoribosyltransferase